LLIGHSRHGYSTLEVARLLIKSGKDVEFVGLLDTYPPGIRRLANLDKRISFHLDNLSDKKPSEILEYFILWLQRSWGRLRNWTGVDDILIGLREKKKPGDRARGRLYNNYKPEPYAGEVTIFTASNRPIYMRANIMEHWSKILTGSLNIVQIPGSHMSMLSQQQASLLAEKITAILRKGE
jgi:oxalate---CoA ligase